MRRGRQDCVTRRDGRRRSRRTCVRAQGFRGSIAGSAALLIPSGVYFGSFMKKSFRAGLALSTLAWVSFPAGALAQPAATGPVTAPPASPSPAPAPAPEANAPATIGATATGDVAVTRAPPWDQWCIAPLCVPAAGGGHARDQVLKQLPLFVAPTDAGGYLEAQAKKALADAVLSAVKGAAGSWSNEAIADSRGRPRGRHHARQRRARARQGAGRGHRAHGARVRNRHRLARRRRVSRRAAPRRD